MTNLVENQQMLRVNNKTMAMLTTPAVPPKFKQSQISIDATNQVISRLKLGYTISRWRAETGEEVAAFNRGPLVPQQVPSPPVRDWPGSSKTSKEFQILDKKTGLMDLSYSAAWQLGKLLAISDTAFNSALMRFRSLVHETAASKARAEENNTSSQHETFRAFAQNVKVIHSLTQEVTVEPRRVPPVRNRALLTDLAHPSLAPTFNRHVADVVHFQGNAEAEIYTEFNLSGPNNTDWTTIFTWLSEKLYLSEIPAHYLIPDPSYLPSEALRFFYIDDAWVDCLIDGALSVANHLDRDDDMTRLRIKQTFNVYLSKNVVDFKRPDGTDVQITPQIPCSGFILKSALVKVMPDLRITVTWKTDHPDRAPVCRYTKLDDTTIFCLLDRSLEELKQIEFAQPPHQQRFCLGYQLQTNPLLVEFKLRQLYTKTTTKLEAEWPLAEAQPTTTQIGSWFNFQSRCFDATTMAKGEFDYPWFKICCH
jgi:hypothetical protein